MKRLLPLVLATLLGCPRKPVSNAVSEPIDANAVLQTMAQQQISEPLAARFNVTIATDETKVTTGGMMLLAPPDRLRMEIQTPLRTPAFLAVSDGQRIDAYSPRGRTFYSGDDAVAVLSELSNGALGISELITLLTGRLPLSDPPPTVQASSGNQLVLQLDGPQGSSVEAQIDPATALVRHLEIFGAPTTDSAAPAEPLATIDVPKTMDFEGRTLPAQLEIHMPSLGWDLTLDIRGWAANEPPDSAFVISAPKGVDQQDLIESLKKMAAERDAHPRP